MKQRILSAIVGIGILLLVLFLYDTPVLITAVTITSILAVYELLESTHFLNDRKEVYLCMFFAGLGVILLRNHTYGYLLALVVFLGILVAHMLRTDLQFTFQQLATCMFVVAVIPLSFSSIFRMEGRIYLILVCICAWVTDTGAYFCGRAFGRKKLAPKISPNKTIEGAIGGLLTGMLLFPAVCWLYSRCPGISAEVSYVHAVLISLLCGMIGEIGDLFASAIKRGAGIKDFGTIMPGHGGIMDRFDSFLFVAPTLYLLISFFPIFE